VKPPPGLRLDHVALPMYDVASTRRFYEESLAMPLVAAWSGDEWEGRAWLMMIFADAGGAQVALCGFRGLRRSRERIPTDARHYAFGAAGRGALAAWRKRLRAAGIGFREEDHGTQRSLYFDDPNGNILEITSPPTPRARARKGAGKLVEAWLATSRAA